MCCWGGAGAPCRRRRLSIPRRPVLERPAIHSEDDLTDSNERFLAAEFLREKLFRLLGEELPYSTGVEIEKFEEQRGLRRIHAAIVVGKEGHKAIIIGSGGSKMKQIATAARLAMETLFCGTVSLPVSW